MTNLTKMVDSVEVEMTDEEQSEFLTQQAIDSSGETVRVLKSQAQSLLTANDKVATRCVKAGVAYPAEWLVYDNALRTIINTGTGTIPSQPAYPANT